MSKRKTWIKVKRGLLEPKHRTKFGIRVWLYLYILDRADWETGKVLEWVDEIEAQEMQMPVDTLRKQRRQLEKDGYITAVQKKHNQEITIHNWTDPRKYDGKEINKGDQKPIPLEDFKGDQSEGLPLGLPEGSPQGYTADGHSSLESHNTKHISQKKEERPSKNQSTWIKALAYLGNHQYQNHPLRSAASPFNKYWLPTEVHSEENGKMVIACVGEDPEYQKAWLEDRGAGIAEKALIVVTGNRIEVEYIVIEEDPQT